MIIVRFSGGLGNQLFEYAAGRCLAHRLGVEFKLDLSGCRGKVANHAHYKLNEFNILENIASEEESEQIKAANFITEASEQLQWIDFKPEVLTAPDNTYLDGCWQNEKYFIEIADIIRKEFTWKAIGATAAKWHEKIRNAECAVSLHIRRGDYLSAWAINLFGAVSLHYYYDCVEALKKIYPQITVFVFSDDLAWAKRNLLFDVPTEFVEGCERDSDEMFLMSRCRHNILANSTFSWWGAWLNQNPAKKVFVPDPWFRNRYSGEDIVPAGWLKMPVDYSKYPNAGDNRDLSIIIYVRNDVEAISECLSSVLTQSSAHFECIIIDDASTDGSSAICRRMAEQFGKLQIVTLNRHIGRGAAYNLGIARARNAYVLFLDARKCLLNIAVEGIHAFTERCSADVFHGVQHFEEDINGNVAAAGKKFFIRNDASFPLEKVSKGKPSWRPKLMTGMNTEVPLYFLADGQLNNSLGTKIFRRSFLVENFIRFDEKLTSNCADIIFLAKCMRSTNSQAAISYPFCFETSKSTGSPSSLTWQGEFDSYSEALDELLVGIDDETLKGGLKFQFVKDYWK